MTLVELKMKKAELRNQMDEERRHGNLCIEPETFIEYNDVIRALRWAESRLLKPIVITLILLNILLISGCGTMAGLQSDIHQVTRPTTLERK